MRHHFLIWIYNAGLQDSTQLLVIMRFSSCTTSKKFDFEPPHDKTQSDGSLRCPHEETLGPHLPIEHTGRLIRPGGCQGRSESSVGTCHFVGFVVRRLFCQCWLSIRLYHYSILCTIVVMQVGLFVVFYWGGGGGGLRPIKVVSIIFHFELSQSAGGAKTGDPREKPPNHSQAELGLSHILPELGSTPQRWDDRQFRALKIKGLNHSATGPPVMRSICSLDLRLKCPWWRDFFRTYTVLLHRALHIHHTMLLIWLKYCWKECEYPAHPSIISIVLSNYLSEKH